MPYFLQVLFSCRRLRSSNKILKAIKKSGFSAIGVFVSSLKNRNLASWLISELQILKPVSIINGTAFSAKDAKTLKSPLDYTECPVFQVIFSTSKKIGWQKILQA